mmetsp:Transcript_47219/g.156512  ORF Transcript_47219/g.156512 Transcript_47219/m.156512 type:complete len:234 (+) Transcript_47219:804-1505(+)
MAYASCAVRARRWSTRAVRATRGSSRAWTACCRCLERSAHLRIATSCRSQPAAATAVPHRRLISATSCCPSRLGWRRCFRSHCEAPRREQSSCRRLGGMRSSMGCRPSPVSRAQPRRICTATRRGERRGLSLSFLRCMTFSTRRWGPRGLCRKPMSPAASRGGAGCRRQGWVAIWESDAQRGLRCALATRSSWIRSRGTAQAQTEASRGARCSLRHSSIGVARAGCQPSARQD